MKPDSQFSPFAFQDPINLYNKKYSLRRRVQQGNRQSIGQNNILHKDSYNFQTQAAQHYNQYDLIKKEEKKLLEEGSSFNCINSSYGILEFNQTISLNVRNHTKTLSTTPSFDNPFASQNYPKIRKSQEQIGGKRGTQKSLTSSNDDLPNKTRSQKTAVSHKTSHNSSKNHGNQRLYTENTSQVEENIYGLEQPKDISKAGKFSLRNTAKMTNSKRSQLLICLKYSDLKEPLKPLKTIYPQDIQYVNRAQQGGLSKYLCSNTKGKSQGCQCQPKCRWINKWLGYLGQNQPNYSVSQSNLNEWQAVVRQVQRDLPRTQPERQIFKREDYLGMLRELLLEYARLDKQVGYVQGMNFIAAAMVYHSRNSQEALRIFGYLMKECGFRKILIRDLELSHYVSKRCVGELKRLAFDLYNHFVSQQVQIEVFITSWYFSMLGSFVPLESMHLIIDKFLRRKFTGLNEIILTLLLYLKPQLLALHDSHLLMAFSGRQMAQIAQKVNWIELVGRSDNLALDVFVF